MERALRLRERPLDDAVIAEFHRAYLAAPCVHTTLLPGAGHALKLGIPCAMVTNKPRAVAMLVLEALGIHSAFVETWAGGDGPMKPAPDGIVAMASRIGVPTSSTWMIGDGPQDVGAARAAGARSIAVRGIGEETALVASRPDVLLGSLEELPSLLRV